MDIAAIDGASRGTVGNGRLRVENAALELFTEHGVSGTSLQMIADAMGVTKAAIYWHFKTKDDIVLGVIKPALERISDIAVAAEARRGRRAAIEEILTGFAEILIDNRRVLSLLLRDAAVNQLLERHPAISDLMDRIVGLLTGPDPDARTKVVTTLFLSGLPGLATDPLCADVADEDLREHVIDYGRRLLLVRRSAAR